jgi:hypothetical protein
MISYILNHAKYVNLESNMIIIFEDILTLAAQSILKQCIRTMHLATMINTRFKQKCFKSQAYLSWIRKQPCAICESPMGIEAHHESFGDKATGKNLIPDTQTIPLCYRHHEPDRHHYGYKTFWNERYNKDPKLLIIRYQTEYIKELEARGVPRFKS